MGVEVAQLAVDAAASHTVESEALTEDCKLKAAGMAFLDKLRLSDAARRAAAASMASFECERCHKLCRLYCAGCCWSALDLPCRLQLGLDVSIACHPKEPASKSSCGPLPLLAEGVYLYEFDPASKPSATEGGGIEHGPGSWLVFPREDAVDAANVDWTGVSKLVLIDSRWKHAQRMAAHPSLARLPALRLNTDVESRFWRTATETLDGVPGLLSTAECLHQLLLLRSTSLYGGTAVHVPQNDRAVIDQESIGGAGAREGMTQEPGDRQDANRMDDFAALLRSPFALDCRRLCSRPSTLLPLVHRSGKAKLRSRGQRSESC